MQIYVEYSETPNNDPFFRFILNGSYVANYLKGKYTKKDSNNLARGITEQSRPVFNSIAQYLYYRG